MKQQHYGTMPIIRQCVKPGMLVLRNGHTYRVSAVIQERKWIYLHSERDAFRINDGVIDIFLNGYGEPLIH
ncbi:cell division protein FtsZ [Salmonella enterica subsp. enterica]|nr:cell division protein FtsZ [Salmonella enterica subsp. enterica serovar Tees]ECG2578850.1 cell division protein FtsZ [Salmonella enterica subsp. enterica]ECG2650971.1 cell division protein FtsZ [Salmonella enterica subsp. enterica serovar Chailey]EDS4706475.1 cell division protein FtsZ [Salmonella enterica]EDV2956087.1 cell division protein FtsZ [Salmonella enterica subsp. enterica]